MDDAKVAVVIVNYNGLRDTLECIDSLLRVDYPNIEIIVVDNGSTDMSLQTLRALKQPSLILLETHRNLGFSGGNNVGIQRALADDCQYVLLLNNDAVIHASAIRILVNSFATNPRLGVAQGKIYKFSQPDCIWNLGSTVAFGGAWMRAIGARQIDRGQFTQNLRIGYASGCMLFTSRTLLEKVGLLEDEFFFQCEDSDLGIRAWSNGFEVVCLPAAQAWHKVGGSAGRSLHLYYTSRNRLLLIKRHSRSFMRLLNIAVHLGVSFAKLVYVAVRERNLRDASAIVFGIVDGLRGRFGQGRLQQFAKR